MYCQFSLNSFFHNSLHPSSVLLLPFPHFLLVFYLFLAKSVGASHMNGQTKIGQNALVDESTSQNQCDDVNDGRKI
jgi:hypothetical protein